MVEDILVQIKSAFEQKIKSIEVNPALTLQILPLGNSFLGEKAANDLLVYEDLFNSNQQFYKGIIGSRLGENQSIYGRECQVVPLDKSAFNTFCDENHYLQTTNAKVRYGLMHKDELVMVAGFSKPRLMYREGEKFQSAELIRSSTKYGFTVVGGLSKLLKHFIDIDKPDDIVTYIDKDFFDGESFKKMGFELYKETQSMVMWLHIETQLRYTTNQLVKKLRLDPSDFDVLGFVPKGYAPIYGQGVMKLVLVIA